MSLVPGRLAEALADRYAVEREIGHGGMATVYLARDLRHDRRVALKVLRPELAAVIGAQRFLQEIKTTANLQHPHILPLHDSGEVDGTVFYVMPFVEGESLRDRLTRETQLPVDDAIRITREVASALDYAHRHGVVHRDIKPENILLHDGQALVADFGIALAVSRSEGHTRLTETGISLGTPSYMSPEQAMGQRDISARSDVYALGAVLYEMLVGEPPFSGPTAQAIVAKILTEKPVAILVRRERVPPYVEAVVLTALEKLPADRFATAREFAEALEGKGAALPPGPPWAVRAPQLTGKRVLTAVLLGGILLGAIAAVAVIRWRSAGRVFPTDWEGELLGGPLVAMYPRVSPDGQSVAFGAMVDGQTQVGVLKLGSGDWTVLTHDRTRGVTNEFAWSRDGTRIYYSRTLEVPRGVFSISPLGGNERLVLEDAGSPQVLPDASLLVSRINTNRLLQLHRFWPETGRLEPLGAVGAALVFRVFPDGKEAVFLGKPASDSTAPIHLYAIHLETGRVRRLAPRLTVEWSSYGTTPLAVSPDGRWVLLDLPAGNLDRIIAVPRDGSDRVESLVTLTGFVLGLDVGPDGSLYVDQGSRPTELLHYSPSDHRLERQRIPFPNGPLLSLPDGRVLEVVPSGGRLRVMVIAPGKDPVPFIDTQEETTWPMAVLGHDRVALRLGSAPNRVVAIASIATGRLVGRLPTLKGNDVTSLAGSPDGKTLFFVNAGVVWAILTEGGEARRVRAGDGVAVDPHGQFLIVQLNEKDLVHLIRVPLAGGAESEVPVRSELRLPAGGFLAPSAVGPDGRIVVGVVSPASWFWPAAILDPRTGKVDPIPPGFDYDMFGPGWSNDGRVVTASMAMQASLWRFRSITGARGVR